MPLGVDAGSAFVSILPDTTKFGASLRAGLNRQGAAAGRDLERGLSASMQRAGRRMSATGGVLTRGLTFPIVAAGLATIKLASDFQASFGRIAAISNASAANIAQWRGEVLQLAGATAKAPKELADALFFLASAGLKSADIMPALTAAAKASAAGLGDITDLAKITANALNAYAGSGLKAADVTDTLVAAVKAGTAEPAEFAGALGRILPIAAKAGVTFDQVAASVAALSNIGLDANEAVTAMRGVLVALQAPGSQAAKTLKEIGISTDQMRASIREKGLLGAMQLLEKATGGNIDQMRKIIPNVRALTGQFGLVGKNAKTVEGIFRQVSRATGDTDKAFKTISQTSEFKFKKALASLQATGITVGTKLLPVVTKVVEQIGGLAEAFGRLSPKTQENIIKFGLLAAAIGPVLKITGGLVGIGGRLITFLIGTGKAAQVAAVGTKAASTQMALFNAQAFAASGAATKGAVATRQLGGVLGFITTPIGLATAAFGLLAAGIIDARIQAHKVAAAFKVLQGEMDNSKLSVGAVRERFDKLNKSISESDIPQWAKDAGLEKATRLTAQAISAFNAITDVQIRGLIGVSTASQPWLAALEKANTLTRDQKKEIALALQSFTVYHGVMDKQAAATIQVAIAQGRYKDALALIRLATDSAAGSEEGLKRARQRHKREIRNQRQALIDLNDETNVQSSSSALAANIQRRQAQAHREAARAADLQRLRVLGLHGEIDGLPAAKKIIIRLNDLASARLREIQRLLGSISHPVTVDVLLRSRRLGPAPPGFQYGGTFHAPTPGGAGLAVLHDKEEIVSRSRAGSARHGGLTGGSELSRRELQAVFVAGFVEAVERLERRRKPLRGERDSEPQDADRVFGRMLDKSIARRVRV